MEGIVSSMVHTSNIRDLYILHQSFTTKTKIHENVRKVCAVSVISVHVLKTSLISENYSPDAGYLHDVDQGDSNEWYLQSDTRSWNNRFRFFYQVQ